MGHGGMWGRWWSHRADGISADAVALEAGAAVDVVILPAFVLSRGFLAFCLASATGLGWLLVRWRRRRATAAIRERFEATLVERARIAGELHDTLLQGFSGVTMQLHAVQRLLDTRPADAARTLGDALANADAALCDARHAVWELRSPELAALDLPEALAAAARSTLAAADARLTVEVQGERRRLPHSGEVAAFRIGREAVANAARHSSARAVALAFDYGPRRFTLSVRDDGQGFAPGDPEGATRDGHWGIVVMRERAQRAGGSLEVDAAPGGGTRITFVLPLGRSD